MKQVYRFGRGETTNDENDCKDPEAANSESNFENPGTASATDAASASVRPLLLGGAFDRMVDSPS